MAPAIRRNATTAHMYLVGLWLVGLALTVFLAGLGVFEVTKTSKLTKATDTKLSDANVLDAHRAAGFFLVIGTLLVLLAAGWARTSRRQVLMSIAFFVLGIVQLILAGAGSSSGAAFGGLHVLNAFILTGLAVSLLIGDRRALATAPAQAPPSAN